MKSRTLIFILGFFLVALLTSQELGAYEEVAGEKGGVAEFKVYMPEHDFGYVYGDTIVIKAEIVTRGKILLNKEKLSLRRMKINDWLDIRVILDKAKETGNRNIYRLTIEYRIFYASFETSVIEIPEYRLSFSDKERTFFVYIPLYSATVSPLATREEAENLMISPLVAPQEPDTKYFFFSLAIFAVSASLLFSFVLTHYLYIYVRLRRNSVFGVALNQLNNVNSLKEAMLITHRAINSYAGCACFRSEIGSFIKDHPEFENVRSELERFFTLSEEIFFSQKIFSAGEEEIAGLRSLLQKMRICETKERRGHAF
ncbi:MAG: hypothetical protein COU46_01785 [Candidatus Niyogibacteria bacterium CG10_big_fil_rev_8_21_14_0_10_42_19]|uniref:MxaA protein n=1 Tax=Candidatus Niyogibacteria bacterium CG10_big_fil_rev_8_21_14_0_10_42_19 TaxID=1974725 RepID=A0A2H0THT4_9BACT|nr:MAG: hypothetical protein COU46_01785 [Candidatus Niyogibacteria bacterium CG10_big_fil_rev_8_21_14_0_10_42_19]